MNRSPDKRSAPASGFSLIEVAIAMGIAGFVFFTLLALLPLAIASNKESAEQTVATGLLSIVEADLRNTHPSLNGGRSLLYGLPLPYRTSNGTVTFNDTLALNTAANSTAAIKDTLELPAQPGRQPYQATVIYTFLPPAGSQETLQARVIINWPSLDPATPDLAAAITDSSRVSGFVEATVSFPCP